MNEKKIKIEFVPGCFDFFEGSQEELEALIAEIQRLANSGELLERSVPIDIENIDQEDLEMIEKIQQSDQTRYLH